MPGWWNADTLRLDRSEGNLVQVQVLFPVPNNAHVAQLDRAQACEAWGRRFESYSARQTTPLKHLGMMSDLVSPRTRFDSVLRHQTMQV